MFISDKTLPIVQTHKTYTHTLQNKQIHLLKSSAQLAQHDLRRHRFYRF